MPNVCNLKVIGKLEDTHKSEVAEEFIQALTDKYPNIEGELYLG